MTLKETYALTPGIYLITWKDPPPAGSPAGRSSDGKSTSLAAVGIDARGDRWLAPCNWLTTGDRTSWRMVESVQLVLRGWERADRVDETLEQSRAYAREFIPFQ